MKLACDGGPILVLRTHHDHFFDRFARRFGDEIRHHQVTVKHARRRLLRTQSLYGNACLIRHCRQYCSLTWRHPGTSIERGDGIGQCLSGVLRRLVTIYLSVGPAA